MSSFSRIFGSKIICLTRQLYVKSNNVVTNRFQCNITNPSNTLCGGRIFQFQPYRRKWTSNFFNKYSANRLWKSVTTVSKAGMRRGRGKGKGKRYARDLNRGQIIGIGRANIRWPGLSAPIIRGRELVQRQHLPEDQNYDKNLQTIRDSMGKTARMKLDPLDRGFCGNKLPGRFIGPPDPIGEDTFDGFDTVVLELKPVNHMSGKFGRVRTISVVAATGNRNGLIGVGMGQAPSGQAAVKRAKNRCGQKLMYIERYNNHTICHDFYSRFGNTKVFAFKRSEGSGLTCHRIIAAMCQVIGIRDMSAKVEGSTNPLNMMRAFLLGLLRQKTPQEMADETKMHLVEMRKEEDYFPKVVASPAVCDNEAEEVPDFSRYVFDGKLYYRNFRPPAHMLKKKNSRFLPIIRRKRENIRSHHVNKLQLIAEYGAIRSFLTDIHPECKPFLPPWSKAVKDAKKLEEDAPPEAE